MNKSLYYIVTIVAAFILGVFSVLWVDTLREKGGFTNPLLRVPPPPAAQDGQQNYRNEQEQGQNQNQNRRNANIAGTPPSFVQAVNRAAPAVVNIYTSRAQRQQRNTPFFGFPFNNPFLEEFFGRQQQPEQQEELLRSLGSGVIVDAEGIIVTNNHVISNADDILVAFPDGRTAEAETVGVDPETDLAVLKVTLDNLVALNFGRDEDISVGDWVLAIGNPYGVGQTVTQGIISAVERTGVGIATYENFIQTDAAINPGNSGGALINTQGELWGINTAIFSRSGGSQGIGFAIPINTVLDVIEQLTTAGEVRRGWMGLYLRDVLPEGQNPITNSENVRVFIAGVYGDSPAARAGLQEGDEILNIDGVKFKSSRELGQYVASKAPETKIVLRIKRGEQTLDQDLTLNIRPQPRNQ